MAKKKTSDNFANRVGRIIQEAAQATLNTVGREGSLYAKKVAEANRDLGRTQDSVTYALKPIITNYMPSTDLNAGNPNMGFIGSAAKQEDIIKPVQEAFLVKIGTAKKGAAYTEFGTGKHINKEGHAEFIQKITEWGVRHGLDQDEIQILIRHIQLFGTIEHPFIRPTLAYIVPRLNALWKRSFSAALKYLPKGVTTINSEGVTFETKGPGA